jgi:hypothetical protein
MTTQAPTEFAGFPREGLDFLAELGRVNTKEWFDAHRSVYQSRFSSPQRRSWSRSARSSTRACRPGSAPSRA